MAKINITYVLFYLTVLTLYACTYSEEKGDFEKNGIKINVVQEKKLAVSFSNRPRLEIPWHEKFVKVVAVDTNLSEKPIDEIWLSDYTTLKGAVINQDSLAINDKSIIAFANQGNSFDINLQAGNIKIVNTLLKKYYKISYTDFEHKPAYYRDQIYHWILDIEAKNIPSPIYSNINAQDWATLHFQEKSKKGAPVSLSAFCQCTTQYKKYSRVRVVDSLFRKNTEDLKKHFADAILQGDKQESLVLIQGYDNVFNLSAFEYQFFKDEDGFLQVRKKILALESL